MFFLNWNLLMTSGEPIKYRLIRENDHIYELFMLFLVNIFSAETLQKKWLVDHFVLRRINTFRVIQRRIELKKYFSIIIVLFTNSGEEIYCYNLHDAKLFEWIEHFGIQ